MKRIPIERKKNLSPADFTRDHLQGCGKPVIVTDAMDYWPARSKWTFDYFKAKYGMDMVCAPLGLNSPLAKVTKLSTYIDYLDTPTDDLPGFWIDTKTAQPLRITPAPGSSPPYLLGWFAFQKHPELYDDILPAPYFVSDWLLALDPALRELYEWTCGRESWSLYLGSAGSLSKLHQDYWRTHSYLAQIQGTKRAILFSPMDTAFLYAGQVDPEQPDFARFEFLARATAYDCVLEPGDSLFTPPGWWHCVRGLDKTITVSHNFFNDVNINDQLLHLLQRLPRIIEGIEKIPDCRNRLGVHWRLSDLAAHRCQSEPALTRIN